MGQTLPIRCSVATCQKSVSVILLKSSQLIAQKKYFDIDGNISLDADLIISADTADEYACRVLLPSGDIYSESFMITGIVTIKTCYIYVAI